MCVYVCVCICMCVCVCIQFRVGIGWRHCYCFGKDYVLSITVLLTWGGAEGPMPCKITTTERNVCLASKRNKFRNVLSNFIKIIIINIHNK